MQELKLFSYSFLIYKSFRRKYTELKAADPGLKLVPLLLSEWQLLYPQSEETVRSFLVRIRFLKSNKEIIKLTLGQHDLLPKMSQVLSLCVLIYLPISALTSLYRRHRTSNFVH